MMSEQQREFFETNGYLVIENALSSNELAALNAALDRDFSERRDTYYSRAERTYQSVRVMEVETAFDALIQHPNTFPVLREIMGDDVAFSELSVIVKEPHTPTHSGWHKDIGYRGVDLTRSLLLVSWIYYLTDVPSGSAAFSVVPQSHRWTQPVTKVDDLDAMPHHVELTGAAGTAILFNANLWHAAKSNRSDLWRRTFHLYYCRPWMKPTGHTQFPPRLVESANTDFQKRFFHANWGAVKRVGVRECWSVGVMKEVM
jgi:ectoine hydroxylase-related dioxygenase (phytanoyl-CoA dioxygenase family)